MKRFRNKKNKEEAATAPVTPVAMTAPPLPVFPPSQVLVSAQPPQQEPKGRWFGMGTKKQTEEEAKPEIIDLKSALPSTDEFRTSLLMTGLSARFSMLREQDDPTTKIGKASDDSVLFPKRLSNHDLGLTLLGDISEVDSLRPWARKNSYGSDDAASMTGSVMNRSRPTDGNNLFGGRQKVYKLVEGKGGMSGRALYDDDVALSAFQKMRREEKQRQAEASQSEEEEEVDQEEVEVTATTTTTTTTTSTTRQRPPSPTDYSHRRETNSTTSTTSSAQSIARLSTAATSVNSNLAPSARDSTGPSPVERSVARTRRLYEQGLNQELHDNQSSAINRLDTAARRGYGVPPGANNPSIADRLGDRRGLLAKSSAPNLRTTLTPPTMATPRPSPTDKAFPASIREPAVTGGALPLTPPISDIDELTFQPIVPPEERKPQTGLGILRPHHHRLGLGLDTRNTTTPVLEIRTAHPDARTTSFLDPDSPDEAPKSAIDVHPVFRDGLPTLFATRPPTEQVIETSAPSSSHDSPTLGLTTGGLSGMVRQHLRADSNASSIYGPAGPSRPEEDSIAATEAKQQDNPLTRQTSANDEFASQLADGARRVRERMTSYVEAESSPTIGPKQSDTPRDPQAAAATRINIVKTKSSYGALDGFNNANNNSSRRDKTMRKLGLAAATMTSSPTVERTNPMDDVLSNTNSPMEERRKEGEGEGDDDDKAHAGLRAFRQAKREMQRLKEIETQQRHMERSPPGIPPQSRDRKHHPPPVSYEPGSRSSSRAPSARERSGSETSGGGSRPPRLRQPMPPMGPMRSPGTPSQVYPPGRLERTGTAPAGLSALQTGPPTVMPYRPYEHSQASPLTLTNPPPMIGQHSVPSSPVGGRIDDSMRRSVRKKDISGPTFMRTTSQVPTVSLEESQSRSGSRSRSGSIVSLSDNGGGAPPLPPINPKRRVLGALGQDTVGTPTSPTRFEGGMF